MVECDLAKVEVAGSNPVSRSGELMEVYRTKDGLVSKYVHDDGSETAIKTVSSCGNIVNKATGKVEPVEVDRNKFSVFVSSSVGCPVGCKFCYLTVKKYPYHRLSPMAIYNNVKEALSAEVKHKPELNKKFMKLSWMGMGDAFLLNPVDLRRLSCKIIEWATYERLVAGLEGIDIATVMPRDNNGWPYQLAKLNDSCDKYKINPSSKDRSNVRIFYSLHSVANRKSLIPCSKHGAPVKDLQLLNKVRQWYGIDIILHYMFLEGVNDSESDLFRLFWLSNDITGDTEIRFLRFNECKHSPYKESPNFDDLVKLCSEKLPRIKYQISAGSEIKAACGQFLCLTNAEK